MRTIKSIIYLLLVLFIGYSATAQSSSPAKVFWDTLQTHCGKAYEGAMIAPDDPEDPFAGKTLIMHVRSCSATEIRIPFFVGNDKSRTWILTYENDRIKLKHDHRHEDGSDDEITMYGGTSSNTGKEDIQIFPADVETQKMLPAAATNVWWITVSETEFSYNLRRLGTDRLFTVLMDLTKPISSPDAPWGWKD